MFSHIKTTHIFVVLGLIGSILSGPSFASDRVPVDPTIPVLTPDDPKSVATIIGPWEGPMTVRVIRLSDVPAVSLLYDDGSDPAAPARIATTIHDPLGNAINVNIVEIDNVVSARLNRRGQRKSVWIVNTDRPFTAATQLQAAMRGEGVAERRSVRSMRQTVDPVGLLSGEPVVEIYVWFDSTADRTEHPNYGIQLVDPGSAGPGTLSPGAGSPPGGGPNGDGGAGIEGGPGGDGPDGGDGADPIGSPDRGPQSSGG